MKLKVILLQTDLFPALTKRINARNFGCRQEQADERLVGTNLEVVLPAEPGIMWSIENQGTMDQRFHGKFDILDTCIVSGNQRRD